MDDASPEIAHEQPDNRFIPVRAEDLAHAIASDETRFGAFAPHADAFVEALDRVIDQEVTALSRALAMRYAPFDADRETRAGAASGGGDEKALIEGLAYVLDKASFEELDEVQIEAALSAANSAGIRVRVEPERISWIRLFVRGRGTTTRKRFSWRRPRSGRIETLETYTRLAVIARLKNDRAVRLKLFRDIPTVDLEALLPHARVGMSSWDKLQVFGGGAGALGGVGSKAFAAATGSAIAATQLVWAFAIAFGGLATKSFFGYRRTMKMRDNQRTKHLYDRALASNASVVSRLLAMIEQEEVKEALLAYAFLASAQPTESDEQVDALVEAWLKDTFGLNVNFDCPDALETLGRLGLWADRGTRRVVEPEVAAARLEELWRERGTERYHLSQTGRSRSPEHRLI
ncbi:MAG: DUF3754 domain-containing protein [Planctomycetota bacterium]